MGSAWNYSAKECSADGKFSAEFEVYEIAMGGCAEFGRAAALRERGGFARRHKIVKRT